MVHMCPTCEATVVCEADRSTRYLICPVCRMEFQVQDQPLSMEPLGKAIPMRYQDKGAYVEQLEKSSQIV